MQYQLNKVALAAAVLTVGGAIVALFITKPWHQASPEMQLLRQTEQKLAMPAPVRRQQIDTGHYIDKQGNGHNVRRITDFYSSAAVVQQVQAAMRAKNFTTIRSMVIDGKTDTVMVDVAGRICAELWAVGNGGAQDSDGPANRVVLMSESDDACSGYLAF